LTRLVEYKIMDSIQKHVFPLPTAIEAATNNLIAVMRAETRKTPAYGQRRCKYG
jgi:hypothetical protein